MKSPEIIEIIQHEPVPMMVNVQPQETPEEWSVAKRSCQRLELLNKFASALEAECPDARIKYAKLFKLKGYV